MHCSRSYNRFPRYIQQTCLLWHTADITLWKISRKQMKKAVNAQIVKTCISYFLLFSLKCSSCLSQSSLMSLIKVNPKSHIIHHSDWVSVLASSVSWNNGCSCSNWRLPTTLLCFQFLLVWFYRQWWLTDVSNVIPRLTGVFILLFASMHVCFCGFGHRSEGFLFGWILQLCLACYTAV